jgi:hypothetical protein
MRFAFPPYPIAAALFYQAPRRSVRMPANAEKDQDQVVEIV